MRDEAGQIVSRCLPCSLPNDRYLGYYGVEEAREYMMSMQLE